MSAGSPPGSTSAPRSTSRQRPARRWPCSTAHRRSLARSSCCVWTARWPMRLAGVRAPLVLREADEGSATGSACAASRRWRSRRGGGRRALPAGGSAAGRAGWRWHAAGVQADRRHVCPHAEGTAARLERAVGRDGTALLHSVARERAKAARGRGWVGTEAENHVTGVQEGGLDPLELSCL